MPWAAGHERPGGNSDGLVPIDGMDAADVARGLGNQGIFVWDGDFYATTLVRRLGLADRGRPGQAGLSPYNTTEEVERTLRAVAEIARRP